MDAKFTRRYESFRKSLDALNEAKVRDMTDSFVLSGTSAKFCITLPEVDERHPHASLRDY